MINKINQFIEKNIILIFTIFLFIQPILDVITGVMLYYFDLTFTFSAIIRIIFLIFCCYYILFVGEFKLKKILYIIFMYCIFFIFGNIIFKDSNNFVIEVKYLLNNIYLSVMLLFIFKILRNNKINEINLFKILMIYLILVFVPNLFNIGFDSYAYSKTGSVGFFYSANAVGSIISILTPLLISYLIIKKKNIELVIFLMIYFYVLLTLGTKAPILCAGIIFIYYLILYIVNLFKNKKYTQIGLSIILIIISIICLIKIIPLTPFYKNLVIHLEFLKIESFTDLLTFENIDHFILSSRLSFFKDTFNIFMESSIYQKLFGIGYALNGKQLKIAEMDYLDMFIHQGIIGFIVIYSVYFVCLFRIFKSYFKKIRMNFFNIRKSSMIISILISILCALLTGHVLATPAVSVFVALLIIISYNDICERKK